MATVGSARIDLSANSAAFVKDMGKARAALKSGTTRMNRSLAKLDRGFRSLSKSVLRNAKRMVSFRGIIATVAGGAGLGFLIKRSIDAADSIGKTADVIGISTDALQEYRFAAGQAGVETAALDKAFKFATKSIGELRTRTDSELITSLKNYDLQLLSNIKTSASVEDALDLVFKKMGQVEDATKRAAIAKAIFGRTGMDMVNIVRGEAGALADLRQEARDLGLVIDERMIRSAEVAKDKLTILGKVIDTNLTRAVLNLSPVIIRVTRNLADLIAEIAPFIEKFAPESLLGPEGLKRRAADIRAEIKQIRDDVKGAALGGQLADLFGSRTTAIAGLEAEAQRLEALIVVREREDAAAKRALETKRKLLAVARERADRLKFINGILANLTTAENRQRQAVDKQVESLRFARAQLGRTADMQGVYNAAKAAGVKVTKEFTARMLPEIKALREEREAQKKAADAAKKRNDEMKKGAEESRKTSDAARELGLTFSSAFEDAIVSGKKFSDVLRGIAQDILRIAARKLVTEPAGNFLTDIFKSILPFSHGGRPEKGRAALVGERGPEIFVPDRAGRIFPDSAAGGRALAARLGGGGGGGGAPVTVNQFISIETGVSQTVRAEMVRLLPALKSEAMAGVQEARRRDPRFFGSAI